MLLAIVFSFPSAAQENDVDDVGDLPVVTVEAERDTVASGARSVFVLTRTGGDTSTVLKVRVRVVYTAPGVSLWDVYVEFEAGSSTARLLDPTKFWLNRVEEPRATITVRPPSVQTSLYTVGNPSRASVTVDESLTELTVATEKDAVVEGEEAVFILTRVGAVSDAMTATFAVTGGETVLEGEVPTSANFDAGATTARVSLATSDDTTYEADADVALTLKDGNGYYLGAPSSATVAVRSEDAKPQVSVADASAVTEGGTLEFPVSLSNPSDTAITVHYSLAGTATAGTDYENPASKTVTIAAGNTEETVELITLDDELKEDDEAVTLTLALPTPDPGDATLGTSTARGTIRDTDTQVVTVAASPSMVSEGTDVVFDLTREGPISGSLTVTFAVTGGASVLSEDAPTSATFPDGSNMVKVPLGTDNDTTYEADADITLQLKEGDDYDLGTASSATVTVSSEDRKPSVSIANASAVTEGGTLEFRVSLSNPSDTAITVDFSLAGTATAGTDYENPASKTVTIPAESQEETISLKTEDDTVDEEDETVDVALSLPTPDPEGATLGTSTARGTIRDNDDPIVTVAADKSTVTEGESAVFVLARVGLVSESLKVTFAVTGGASVLSEDAPTSATFPGGSNMVRVSLGTDDDDTYEADADITLRLNDGDDYDPGAASSATVTVRSEDGKPSVSIADADAVTEGGTLEFRVSLSNPSDTAITVVFSLAGTATAGADYEDPTSKTVTIAAGSEEETISLKTLEDELKEDSEMVDVTLSLPDPNPDSATLGTSSASGTIIDEVLSVVTVGAKKDTVAYGEHAVFVLARTGDVTDALKVRYQIVYPAKHGNSFASGFLEIEAGKSALEFLDPTRFWLNSVESGRHKATMRILTPNALSSRYQVGDPSSAVVTLDEGALPSVTVEAVAATVTEGTAAEFDLTRTGDPSEALTVTFNVTGGNSVLSGDAPDTATFDAGALTKRVSLATSDDTTDEASTDITLTVTDGDDYDLGSPSAAMVEVTDNDNAPVVSVDDANAVTEGGTLEFRVSLSNPSDTAIAVDYSLAGTATAGSDYEDPASKTVTIAAGGEQKTISLKTLDDSEDEAQENVQLTLSLPSPDPSTATIGTATASGAILDNDSPTVTIASDGPVREGSDASFTLSRVGYLPVALTVGITITETGGMVAATDKGMKSATFDAGSKTAKVMVPTLNDSSVESDSTVTVAIEQDPGAGYLVGSESSARVVVEDDDSASSVASAGFLVSNTMKTESGELQVNSQYSRAQPFATGSAPLGYVFEGAVLGFGSDPESTVTVTIREDDGSNRPGTILHRLGSTSYILGGNLYVWNAPANAKLGPDATYYVVAEGSGKANWSYTNQSGVDSGSASGWTISRRSMSRGGVGAWSSSGSSRYHRVQVRGSEVPLPVVTIESDGDRTEGENASFTLTRTENTEDAVTVDVKVTESGDVVSSINKITHSVKFGANASTAIISVPTLNDSEEEEDSTVTAAIADGDTYTSGDPSSAGVLVMDDDGSDEGLPVVMVVLDGDGMISEGEDVEFLLTRTGDATGKLSVTFDIETVGGVLTERPPSTAIFGAGESEVRVTLKTLEDSIDEPNALVTLTLTEGEDYELGGSFAISVTVQDDDDEALTLGVGDDSAKEDGSLEFVATLSREVSREIEFSYATMPGTADASDYTGVAAGTGSIPAGSTTAVISIALMDDDIDEPDERMTIEISNPSVGVTISDSTATGTIVDDDLPTVSVASGGSVTEGNAAVFTLTRTKTTASETLLVLFSVTGGSAVLSGAPPVDVTFKATEAIATVSIPTMDDEEDEPNATVTLTLSASDDYEIGTASQVSVTVQDDDSPVDPNEGELPVVTVAPAGSEVVEGENAVFTLTRTGEASGELDVEFSVTDSGSVLTVAPPTEATFPAGATTARVALSTRSDSAYSSDSEVTLDLEQASGYSLDPSASSATVVVADDEVPPVLSLQVNPTTIEENGGVAQVTIATEPGSTTFAADQRFRVRLSGQAFNGIDYSISPSGGNPPAPYFLVLPAGANSVTATITALDDADYEMDEIIRVKAIHVGGSIEVDPLQEITIVDDEASAPVVQTPALSSAVSASEIAEAGGIARVTVSISAGHAAYPRDQMLRLRLRGQAIPGTDYSVSADGQPLASPYVLTLPAGAESVQAVLTALDNNMIEPDRTIIVKVVHMGGNKGVGEAHSILIADDDDVEGRGGIDSSRAFGLAMEVSDEEIAETGGTSRLTISTTPAGTSYAADQSIRLRLRGQATVGEDYRVDAGGETLASPFIVTLPAGATTVTATVVAIDDSSSEGEESILLRAIHMNGGGRIGSERTIAIVDDDPSSLSAVQGPVSEKSGPALSIDSPEVVEGALGEAAELVFTVRLRPSSDEKVTVGYGVTGGSATAGVDYQPVGSGSISFAPGSTSEQIRVAVIGDDLAEPDESVEIALDGPSGASLAAGKATGVGTILRDLRRPWLTPSAVTVFLGEPGGGEVALEAAVSLDRMLDYEVAVDAVLVPADSQGESGDPDSKQNVVFPAGTTSQTVSRRIPVEQFHDETLFVVKLSNPRATDGARPEMSQTPVQLAENARGEGRSFSADRAASAAETPEESRFARRNVSRALASVGRSFATGMVDALWERADSHRNGAGDVVLELGGRNLDAGALGGGGLRAASQVTGLFGVEFAAPGQRLPQGEPQSEAEGGFDEFLSWAGLAGWREMIDRTRFSLSVNGGSASRHGLGLWGKGDFASFSHQSGAGAGESFYADGHSATGHFGFEYGAGERLVAGLAFSRSGGEAEFGSSTGALGDGLKTAFSSSHSYLHRTFASGVGIWSALGLGSGTATIEDGGLSPVETDLAMRNIAAGLRGPAGTAGLLELAVKADAFATRFRTGGADAGGRLGGVEGEASRLRVAIDGASRGPMVEGIDLTGAFELGALREGGDAGRGAGADFAAELRFTDRARGLDIAWKASVLRFQREDSVSEWSTGMDATWDPGAPERGLRITLSPGWNASGAESRDSIWRLKELPDELDDGAGDGASIAARLGYGMEALNDRMLVTLYGDADHSSSTRGLRIGAELQRMDAGSGSFGLDLYGLARRDRDGESERVLMLEVELGF